MERIVDHFNRVFSKDHLNRIFFEKVQHSKASGVDNLKPDCFSGKLDEATHIIERKVASGTYRFTRYRLKLISKGAGRAPREISIPTVRDRIVLRALSDFLMERFRDSLQIDLPQNVIRRVKVDRNSRKFDTVIKLDISNFFPSIDHGELEKRLRKRIRHPRIVNLVNQAISSPTSPTKSTDIQRNNRGVPQGLSISNVLAAIYLINIDRYIARYEGISYHRFVDDILIFCQKEDCKNLLSMVIKKFRNIRLLIHDPEKVPEKSSVVKKEEKFSYLGYVFHGRMISVRHSSINKLKDSIASIFTSYKYSKHKSKDLLSWRLNLRITGCIYENKCKGWLFFFSEINDETLLHTLDSYIRKLCFRFRVNIKPKKFSRAFKEIKYRKHETNYVPNFDKINLERMRRILLLRLGESANLIEEKEIESVFHKVIRREIRDLQEDIQDFGY